MSYYFAVVSTNDAPLFEYTFGTSKAGGDGRAHFRNTESSRYMNQFIVHAALDMVEEAQWLSPNMYLKIIDHYPPTASHVSCFMTGTGVRFMLLHQASGPDAPRASKISTLGSNSVGMNPTSPQAEEAIRQFMTEIYESWVKCLMNPFYNVHAKIESPIFRQRVVAAGRKWL